jgi:hypothetical protein
MEITMVKSDDDVIAPNTVECAVCKKLIPPSEAISREAHEYVLYFCGGECHAEWEREQAQDVEQAFEEHSGVKRD